MSFQVTTAHRVTYQNNVELALQQKRAKLAPYAMRSSYSGEKSKIKDLIGSVKPGRQRTRHGDTQYNNTPHDARWIAPTDPYTYADLVDRADQVLAPGIDLQGAYTMAAAATMSRSEDAAFLEGFYGNAMTGKSGEILVPFAPSNIIPVNTGATSPTGLNIPKLRTARQMFVKGLVDLEEEELFMAVTSEQTDDLLGEIQATSAEFASSKEQPVIVNGKLTKLLGFNFIEVEYGNTNSFDEAALTVDGSGYRRVPAWCKSGMAIADWEDVFTSIDALPQKNHSVQVYARRIISASRTDEAKCLQVLCAE